MKSFFLFVALIVSMNEAFAKGSPLAGRSLVRWGEQCGFADGFDEDTLGTLPGPVTIENGVTLDDLQTRQIIQAAQTLAAPWDEDQLEPTLEASIAWLVEASEGGEVYLKEAKTPSASYTYVIFYPGGNPVGVIFLKGTLTDVAHIEDSDIVCTD